MFDSYQRQRPREYRGDLPVRIVDIDEESLKRLGQWPWPRDLMAQLVDRLGQLRRRRVALDIIFAEPDRFSPANLARVWQDRPELASLRASLPQLPDSDAVLAQSLAHTPSVTAFALSMRAGARHRREAGIRGGRRRSPALRAAFPGAVTTLPAIEAAAAGNGARTTFRMPTIRFVGRRCCWR